jgi:ABC-2 type transport system permease protein
MKKILLVLKNEIITVISRRSFWLALLGLPLAGSLIFVTVGLINRSGSTIQTIEQVLNGSQEALPDGFVDLSRIIHQIPDNIPSGTFIAFSSEDLARRALTSSEISGFYIVPVDYVQNGRITYIQSDFNPLASTGGTNELFTWVIQVNLAGGDVLFANLLNGPMSVNDISLTAVTTPDENNPLAFWTPYIITLLFYMLIIISSTLLLSSVSKEKESRIIEILLSSATPRQLLTGKVLGLGIVGLGQMIFWFGTSIILLNLSGNALQLPSEIKLPVSFLIWGVVFFLLGFGVYASLMAGLGALAPNLREASQVTIIILLPLLVPLFLSSSVFLEDPNGMLATILSIFPLTSPVAMMARLSAGGVTWWQPLLAILLLVITVGIILRTVSGMFRAQVLLSGQTFSLKRYLWALAGKV